MLRHDKKARLLAKVAGKGGKGDASVFTSTGVDAAISHHKHNKGTWASGTDLQPVVPVPLETKRPILADDFPKNLAEIVNAKYQALREEAHHTEEMHKTPSGEKAPSAETLVDVVPTGAGRLRLQAIADGLTSSKNTTGGDYDPLYPRKVTFGNAKADKPIAVGQDKVASHEGCCNKCGAKCAKCSAEEEKKEHSKKASAVMGSQLGQFIAGAPGAALGAAALTDKKKNRGKAALYSGLGSVGGTLAGALGGAGAGAIAGPHVAVPLALLGAVAGGHVGAGYGAHKAEHGSKVRAKLKKNNKKSK
jgi:hypothetical protein